MLVQIIYVSMFLIITIALTVIWYLTKKQISKEINDIVFKLREKELLEKVKDMKEH